MWEIIMPALLGNLVPLVVGTVPCVLGIIGFVLDKDREAVATIVINWVILAACLALGTLFTVMFMDSFL